MPDIENLIETKPAPETTIDVAGMKKLHEMSLFEDLEGDENLTEMIETAGKGCWIVRGVPCPAENEDDGKDAYNVSNALDIPNTLQTHIDNFVTSTTVDSFQVASFAPQMFDIRSVMSDFTQPDLVYGKGDL